SATPEDALDLFYTGWTRKEACLKALGTGLSLDPREVHVGLRHPSACVGVVLHGRQQRIHIVSLQLGDEVHAAVARCDTSA
ncbi:4'-phosphopantetheinyl transferase superfamily protein, partial [Acinetobacter baumannii]